MIIHAKILNKTCSKTHGSIYLYSEHFTVYELNLKKGKVINKSKTRVSSNHGKSMAIIIINGKEFKASVPFILTPYVH